MYLYITAMQKVLFPYSCFLLMSSAPTMKKATAARQVETGPKWDGSVDITHVES